jgi:hypothetical protein
MKNILIILLLSLSNIVLSQDFNCKDFHYKDYFTPICDENIRIYPNPTNDIFTVEGANTEGYLFAANGQFLRRVEIGKVVNITDLAQGIYFLRLKDRVFKIVKI